MASPLFQTRRLGEGVSVGFPHSSTGKESACNAGDSGSIPGSGRSPVQGIGYPLQYSWASPVAQLVKNPPAVWEIWVRSLIPGLGSSPGSSPGSIPGLGRSAGEGKGYSLQYSGLENSMDTVHGVAKSRTRLSDFHFHFWIASSLLNNVSHLRFTPDQGHQAQVCAPVCGS